MEDLYTLQKKGQLCKKAYDTFDVAVDRVFDPHLHSGTPRFREATRPERSGRVTIERLDDTILVDGILLDSFFLPNRRLHPNIAIALFHLDSLKFIPPRYKRDTQGKLRKIFCKEVAFRNEAGDIFWLVLRAETLDWVVEMHPARIEEMDSGEWVPIGSK